MAKSKQQKQQEALERKQAQFEAKRQEMIDKNVGGNCYVKVLNRDGLAAAEDLKNRANMSFGKYLREAQLNAKGEIVLVVKGERHENINVGKNRLPGAPSKRSDLVEYLDDMARGF